MWDWSPAVIPSCVWLFKLSGQQLLRNRLIANMTPILDLSHDLALQDCLLSPHEYDRNCVGWFFTYTSEPMRSSIVSSLLHSPPCQPYQVEWRMRSLHGLWNIWSTNWRILRWAWAFWPGEGKGQWVGKHVGVSDGVSDLLFLLNFYSIHLKQVLSLLYRHRYWSKEPKNNHRPLQSYVLR